MSSAGVDMQGMEYPVTALLLGWDEEEHAALTEQLTGDSQLDLIRAREGESPQKIAAHRGVTVIVQRLTKAEAETCSIRTLRDFRESEVCRDIPILALVPHTDPALATLLLQAGADVVLPPPVEPTLLSLQMRSLARVCFERIELDSLRQALRKTRKQLREAREQANRLIEQDPLTGMFTPQRFALLYEVEWQRAMRETNPIALLAIEIDRFDAYVAHFGKRVADDCLRRVARAVVGCLNRTTDIAARDEGAGFTVLLPNTPVSGGIKVGAAIHQAVQELRLLYDEANPDDFVSVSLGLVTTSPMVRHTAQMLRLAAAKALANAKSKGGNQLACEAI